LGSPGLFCLNSLYSLLFDDIFLAFSLHIPPPTPQASPRLGAGPISSVGYHMEGLGLSASASDSSFAASLRLHPVVAPRFPLQLIHSAPPAGRPLLFSRVPWAADFFASRLCARPLPSHRAPVFVATTPFGVPALSPPYALSFLSYAPEPCSDAFHSSTTSVDFFPALSLLRPPPRDQPLTATIAPAARVGSSVRE